MKTLQFDLHRQRTIGENVRAALDFFFRSRQLFFPLGILAVTVIVAALSLAILITGNANSLDNIFAYKTQLSKNSFAGLCLVYLLYVLGLFMLVLNCCRQIWLSASENPSALGTPLLADASRSIINFLIVFVLYSLADKLLLYGTEILAAEVDYFADASSLAGNLIVYSPVLVFRPFLLYFSLVTLFVAYRERTGVDEALKKVYGYSAVNLRKVWLAGLVYLLIAYTVLFLLQVFVYMVYETLYAQFSISHNMLFAGSVFRFVFFCLLLTLMQIGLVFVFGAIEDEKEDIYIKRKLDEI